MSLKFVFGSSGAGKSYFLFDKIISAAIRYPDENFIVIVPEQFTLQTQKTLVQMHPGGGILNIDVLSFERLAYRVMEELGAPSLIKLDDMGKNLILQKVAYEHLPELNYLKTNITKTGYISEVKSFISELIQYDIGREDMSGLIEIADLPLRVKLEDVYILYEAFMEKLSGCYITAEEVLDILSELIPRSEKLRRCTIALDGYTGFTPLQNKVLRQLITTCRELYVTITIPEDEDPYHIENTGELFSLSKKTVSQLIRIARDADIVIQEAKIPNSPNSRFKQRPDLSFLESNLFRYNGKQFKGAPSAIAINEYALPKEEVLNVACQIRKLIRKEGMRYRDIAVITANTQAYREHISDIFAQADIPCFIDQNSSVLGNPFVEYIRALFEIAGRNYSYDSMFRFLRCGLSDIPQSDIDELENYCIALGIRGKSMWAKPWTRVYKRMDKERLTAINDLRKHIFDMLDIPLSALASKELTVCEKLTAVYEFIEKGHIQEKLFNLEGHFNALGNSRSASEYSQVYGIVMELFDKVAEILGDEKMGIEELSDILDAGFFEGKIGLIPPGADQVIFGDMQRTRLPEIQVLFFIGADDSCIPGSISGSSIISDMERELLSDSGVTLAPTARENIYIEKFYLYFALTRPQSRLCISYSLSSDSGEARLGAFIIPAIQRLFPDLETGGSSSSYEYPKAAFDGLVKSLQSGVMSNQEKELYSWFSRHEGYSKKLSSMIEAMYYTSPHSNISKQVAAALYGSQLKGSASRLELFSGCALSHFLEYGMCLAERQKYEFRQSDLGVLTHQALEHFARAVQKTEFTWGTLPEKLRDKLIDETIEQISGDYGNTVLHSSAGNEYIIIRLKRILKRTVWALQKQLASGDFMPDRFEVSFEMEEQLGGGSISPSEGKSMLIGGRIDRIDICQSEDIVYVRIIDYKSGSASFDLSGLYHGIRLQLVMYLQAALELTQKRFEGKEVVPAGLFYYHVKDPVVDGNDDTDLYEIIQKILKELKMDGLVLDKAASLMDTAPAANGSKKSDVIPISYKKDGTFDSHSSVATPEQFELLIKYVRDEACRLAERILSGESRPRPYIYRNSSPCAFCPYIEVCGFDEHIPGYLSRKLRKFSDQEIWNELSK